MKIIAVADLHGALPEIPPCDVLLLCGDNAPDMHGPATANDPDLMRVKQMQWFSFDYADWEKRVPAKHIFLTPGNHDWYVRLPEHLRTRMFVDDGISIPNEFGVDISFWFTPWVSPCGDWNYLMTRGRRKEAFNEIPPRVDVLVAHSPAHRVGDRNKDGERIGCPELRQAIQNKKPRHVFFGHCHEGYRDGRHYQLGDTHLWHASLVKGRSGILPHPEIDL